MLALRALAGLTTVPGSFGTPFQTYIDIATSSAPGGPPWAGAEGDNDPSQSFSEMIHYLHTMDQYGPPDWSLRGQAVAPRSPGTFVFTAAFTKAGTTTYVAFNPTSAAVSVNFFDVSSEMASLPRALSVPANGWAISPTP